MFQDPTEQVEIDNFMVQQLDGTSNDWGWCKQKVSWSGTCVPKLDLHLGVFVLISFDVCVESTKLGANAILAVSLAVCKAGAMVKKIPLYQVYQMLPPLFIVKFYAKYRGCTEIYLFAAHCKSCWKQNSGAACTCFQCD